MNTETRQATEPESDQREALKDSERKASEEQPGSFKDEAMEEKIVDIPPVGKDEQPIKGLDPK